MYDTGVNPTFYEFLLAIDADTVVDPFSLNRFISAMTHDRKVIATCGETELSNAKKSMISMMQVYEVSEQFSDNSASFLTVEFSSAVLHLPSFGQSIRVTFRQCYMSSWVFLSLPTSQHGEQTRLHR